ncbi:MAG: hypothetical protein ACKPJO_02385 [Dolichospermum sp.]
MPVLSLLTIISIQSPVDAKPKTFIHKCIHSPTKGLQLKPSIPDSVLKDGSCYVPVEAGKCIATKGGDPFQPIVEGTSISGFYECHADDRIETDKITGKKYYKFSPVPIEMEFVLER